MPGKVAADIAATGENDPAYRAVQRPQFFHHGPDVALCSEKKYRVIFLDDGISIRNNGLVLAVNGRDSRLCVRRHVFTQCLQTMPDKRAAGVSLGGHQLSPAIGKVQHLQCARVFNQTGNMLSDQGFGADQHVNRTMFALEQLRVLDIFRRTNAGNSCGRVVQSVRNLAGCHIDFITAGQRNDQIGVFYACTHQHLGVRGMPNDPSHVQPVLQDFHPVCIQVDNRDVVLLVGEAVGDGGPHLARAQYDNFHFPSPFNGKDLGSTPNDLSFRYRWVRSMPTASASLPTLPPASPSL